MQTGSAATPPNGSHLAARQNQAGLRCVGDPRRVWPTTVDHQTLQTLIGRRHRSNPFGLGEESVATDRTWTDGYLPVCRRHACSGTTRSTQRSDVDTRLGQNGQVHSGAPFDGSQHHSKGSAPLSQSRRTSPRTCTLGERVSSYETRGDSRDDPAHNTKRVHPPPVSHWRSPVPLKGNRDRLRSVGESASAGARGSPTGATDLANLRKRCSPGGSIFQPIHRASAWDSRPGRARPASGRSTALHHRRSAQFGPGPRRFRHPPIFDKVPGTLAAGYIDPEQRVQGVLTVPHAPGRKARIRPRVPGPASRSRAPARQRDR